MKAYMLRTCDENMRSNRGKFQWPLSGEVVAPDWSPDSTCGGGLHGLLGVIGDGTLLCWKDTARWLVCSIDPYTYVDLEGCIKVECATVEFVGSRERALNYLLSVDKYASPSQTVGCTVVVGDYRSATTGYHGDSTAGKFGSAVSGPWGKAASGDFGTSVVGNFGSAETGDFGTSLAGDSGIVSAGYGGVLLLRYMDITDIHSQVAIAHVGINGIKPNVKYRLNKDHEFEEVK